MTRMHVPVFGRQPWVMGVVNVTPDSFSDGGQWLDTDAAISHGRMLAAAGASIVDVGGESTRPGAHRVDAAAEKGRVVPVIEALAADGITCSVDTSRAEVAAAAIEAGVAIVNDVSGGMADPDMVRVVADAHVPWVIMHWRGPSETMNSLAKYRDVALDVRDELLARVDVALAAGIDERSLILDPGLGFAKDAEHNWEILRRIDVLTGLGFPVMLGASRKRFLGELLAADDGAPRPADGRESATAAVSIVAALHGVWAVRVHDVTPTLDALNVFRSGYAASHAPTTAQHYGVRQGDRGVNRADHITLTGLAVRGNHGVFEYEKRDGQDFVIDATVWMELAAAAAGDDLAKTLNYAELAELARSVVAGPPRDLIETVATEIADTAVARWPIDSIEVTLHKPHAPIPLEFADVAVTVRRDGQHRGGQSHGGAGIAGQSRGRRQSSGPLADVGVQT